MTTNRWLRPVVLACLAACLVGTARADEAARRPNVLIFYIDDMGWAQPSCYGGQTVPTPHIDALAAGGVRFTNGYVSACVCSPSRVGLLTGRYQQRTGHDANTTARGDRELDRAEVTLGQRMREAGYTTAIVGKWHVGDGPEFLPAARGFDESFGTTGNLGEGSGPQFYRGTQRVADPEGSPITSPIFAREAVRFIERQPADQPWFLYLSFNAVHTPHVASPKWLEKFAHLPNRDQRYAALVAEADEAIGTVMDRLRELRQENNTLVFCISDNGGAAAQADMGGLRGRKWFVWEGGIRVSWIMQWKARIPSGQVIDEPVIQLDCMPTMLAAAGVEVRPEWELDGVNLLPRVTGAADTLPREALFWRFGVQYAVRRGDWKLVKAGKDLDPMLVNLASDPGEQTDLSAVEPERAAALQALWDRWNATMQPPRWEDQRWNGDENRKQRGNRRTAPASDPAA